MKYIIGKKVEMSQIFDKDGCVHAVTIVEATPNVIVQVKKPETDGYNAVSVGFGTRKEKNINKAQLGQFKEMGKFSTLKEFRLPSEDPTTVVGNKIEVSAFKEGDTVAVSSISKGKGFQGVVKRHGFKGGSRTHGQKHSEREPGTIGGGLRTRVPSGMRMAGRMGGTRITVRNLKVLQVHADRNLLLISGAIPGRRGTVLEITSK